MMNLLLEFYPTTDSVRLGAATGMVAFLVAGWLAAVCRRNGFRTGDTRKLFHFGIFTAAAILRWQSDTGTLVVFGAIVVSGVFAVCWLGPGNPIWEALARPSDQPQQRLHVIIPLLCTGLGGVIAQLVAGKLTIVAYLIGGWGDAVGEPIGIRYGKHQYQVPALGGIPATRSWEGSLAVFIASTMAATLGLSLVGQTGSMLFGVALLLGVVTTLVEAASPHGTDNLTILVAAALILRCCVSAL